MPTKSSRDASLSPELATQLEALRRFVGGFSSAITAYSGGVDSALVMCVAHQVLGEHALSCIGVSASYPERERVSAIELAESLGAQYRVVSPDELDDPRYRANPDERCYFCKSALYGRIRVLDIADRYEVIFDGTNADDQRRAAIDRPGIRAARERGVRSPLAETGIDKQGVRAIARHLGLPVWDKPAMACLASRVPHGDPISVDLLQRIERAEDFLATLGFRQFRVRVHREVTRIEVPADAFDDVIAHREAIVTRFAELGHHFVALDLAGFRSGSMNATRSQQPLTGEE